MDQDVTLAHLGYVVPNIERSAARWEREGASMIIEPTADPIQRVSVCLLRTLGEVNVELVAPLESGDSPVESRLKRGGGLDHVCYDVDDVGLALRSEVDRGAVVVCEPTYACAFDRTIGFVHRRSGLIVEFMSRAAPNP